MWFRNLCIYALDSPLPHDPTSLAEALARFGFEPVARTEPQSRGWVAPLQVGEAPLVYAAGHCMMLCLQEQSRLLPPAVVREALEERLAAREDQEGRSLGRRERLRLKDEITLELLPRAFTRTRRVYGYVDSANGVLVVDSGSWNEAEEFAELLRSALGTLPVRPLSAASSPQAELTRWLAHGDVPPDVELGEEGVLEDPKHAGAEVRVKRQDLASAEIRAHIKAGKRVRRLALTWNQRVGGVLDADLSIKRLKFLDLVQEEQGDREPESAAERFDADFAIMTQTLARLIERLQALFGQAEEAATGATQPR